MTVTEYDEIQLYSSKDIPYGISYGAWTTKWWEWIMPFPKEKSPLWDLTGESWNLNQPTSDVWFLIGNFAEVYHSPLRLYPRRHVTMESGRSILFPVLNCMATFLEYKDRGYTTHEDLLRHVNNDVNSVVKKDLFINDEICDPVRVQSEPKIFTVPVVEDNAFNIAETGITEAAAEGYWAFLKPLSKGKYTIRFEGSCENGRLSAGASYELDII